MRVPDVECGRNAAVARGCTGTTESPDIAVVVWTGRHACLERTRCLPGCESATHFEPAFMAGHAAAMLAAVGLFPCATQPVKTGARVGDVGP